MKRILKLFAIAFVVTTLARPTFAIFGFGDIVFDPSNYAEAIQQLLQMEQQYAQLVQTYQMVRSQYDHLVWMAKRVPVNMTARYKAISTPWRTSSAGNSYGNTGGWTRGINTGVEVASGYAEATQA